MIVKMKKATIMVASKHLRESLIMLRKLGVMHIKNVRQPTSDRITSLQHRIVHIDKALDVFSQFDIYESQCKQGLSLEEALDTAKKAANLASQIEELEQHKNDLEGDLSWYQELGIFSLNSLDILNEAGIFIRLYACDKKSLKTIAKDKIIKTIKQKGSKLFIALISQSQEDRLDFTEIKMPGRSYSYLTNKIKSTKKFIEDNIRKISELALYRNCLTAWKQDLSKRLNFAQVSNGAGSEDGFYYVNGYCPISSTEAIKQVAQEEGWAYYFSDPKDPSEVPTLIRTPKWVNIIKPIFSFMATIPGYKEFDISFWFLLFFSLFFAMIIGDAGYGFIFLFSTFFAKNKFPKAPKEPFALLTILSIATICWGAVTGTWFGFEKIAQLPFLNVLVIERINSFVDVNQMFMMYMSFVIGLIHLTIAHAVLIFRYINSLKALAQLGWMGMVWVVFFVAGKLILSKPTPSFLPLLFFAAVALILLFSNPQKNIFKGILLSLANLPLTTINYFADVVSYIRLFAVGYATVAVASSFNELAANVGFNSFFIGVASAAILLLGHALNIVLGLMSVIVHGIRLNMLEFSGHLDMEWSGLEYKPFKE